MRTREHSAHGGRGRGRCQASETCCGILRAQRSRRRMSPPRVGPTMSPNCRRSIPRMPEHGRDRGARFAGFAIAAQDPQLAAHLAGGLGLRARRRSPAVTRERWASCRSDRAVEAAKVAASHDAAGSKSRSFTLGTHRLVTNDRPRAPINPVFARLFRPSSRASAARPRDPGGTRRSSRTRGCLPSRVRPGCWPACARGIRSRYRRRSRC